MPVYEYKCEEHGVFYGLATMDESDKPSHCTTCGGISPRIIRIAPEILDMSPSARKAAATNERSQHEPTFSTKDRRESDDEHSSGCGCNKQKPGKSKLMYTAQGDKMFPSMRPWMISH
ncbi:MAG: FmdB family zinc ribbon protein [Cellvibrionaceae bacterium]